MQQPNVTVLAGGLDLVSPAMTVGPGYAVGCTNYEADAQGYRRYIGHERFDGQDRPSEATYWILYFDAGTAAINEDDVVTGATSGATAKALVDAVVTSGTYGGSDAAGYLVLTALSGTFQDNENLQVSAVTKSVANGTTDLEGADTDANDALWKADAIATQRALIAHPTGSGPIRGVHAYEGDVYCIRDNAGGTAATLWKSTTAGWVAQDLGYRVHYNTGAIATFVEGETITGGTSSATATIRRLIVTGGTFSGGDATGRFTLSDIVGTFQFGETVTGGTSTGTAALTNTVQANVRNPGGRYEFINHNFGGAANSSRMYGVNGTDRAMEWDGTYFTEILSGLTVGDDKPSHIAEFQEHLFLGYAAGSWIFSAPGDPVDYIVSDGAGEIATGDEVTGGFGTGAVLLMMGSNKLDYLTGTGASTFVRQPISPDSGAQRYTLQMTASPIYARDNALYALNPTADTLAAWRMASISFQIEPMLKAMRAQGVTPTASSRSRNRDLYRLFLSDGKVISVYLGRRRPEIMLLDLPFVANCAYSGDAVDGKERTFVGTTDGEVYELDSGRDFDGDELTAFVRLGWNSMGQPRLNKRFTKAFLETEGDLASTLSLTAEFDYAASDLPAPFSADFSIDGGGGFWNEGNWNEFRWSSPVVGTAVADIDGFGRNISPTVAHTSSGELAHVLSVLTINWSPRGQVKL